MAVQIRFSPCIVPWSSEKCIIAIAEAPEIVVKKSQCMGMAQCSSVVLQMVHLHVALQRHCYCAVLYHH